MANDSVVRFQRRLARITPAVRRAAMASLEANVEKMASTMRAAVPKDEGTLAASIKTASEPSRLRAAVFAGGKTTTRELRKGSGVEYDYARAVEFGTTEVARQPFFWPVYRLLRKSARASVKRAMRKAIKSEFPTEG